MCSDLVFLVIDDTPITISLYKSYGLLEIGYLREILSVFNRTEEGWVEDCSFSDVPAEDARCFSDLIELLESVVVDMVYENCGREAGQQAYSKIIDKFRSI
jgi:hypothetical protein